MGCGFDDIFVGKCGGALREVRQLARAVLSQSSHSTKRAGLVTDAGILEEIDYFTRSGPEGIFHYALARLCYLTESGAPVPRYDQARSKSTNAAVSAARSSSVRSSLTAAPSPSLSAM